MSVPYSQKQKQLLQALASAAAVLYVVGFSLFILSRGGWPTPDFLIPPLIFIALLYGRGWRFVVDWTPFLLLILVYEAFRGLAPDLHARVHVSQLVAADGALTGGIVPTTWLQSHFYHPGQTRWYDWLATGLHAAHFAVPVCYAFLIWLADRRLYWRYLGALLGLSFAGFATYLLYPAAPPWMAADMGLLPPVHRILSVTLGELSRGSGLTLTYQFFSPNPVAAMPSLHAAMPLLLALVAIASHGKRALPLLLYPICGGIAWMYLGEHYLVDVLAGYLYGALAFVMFWLLLPRGLAWLSAGWHRPSLARLPRLQPLPAWPLALAVTVIALYGWVRLASLPGAPATVTSTADAAVAAEPVPLDCTPNSSVAPGADDILNSVSKRYSAFIQALDSPTCLSLSGERAFAPLDEHDLDRVREAAAGGLSQFPLSVERGVTYVRVGKPSDALLAETGGSSGESYAVVIRVGRGSPGADVRQALSDIAGFALGADPQGE